jgi:uncharacterized protein
MVSPELLSILVCPACRAKVEPVGDELVCRGCARRYLVRAGIPIMLVAEEARIDSNDGRDAAG